MKRPRYLEFAQPVHYLTTEPGGAIVLLCGEESREGTRHAFGTGGLKLVTCKRCKRRLPKLVVRRGK